MDNLQAQKYISECRRMLEESRNVKDQAAAAAFPIGSLVLAIELLATVVEDLANREQGRIIQ